MVMVLAENSLAKERGEIAKARLLSGLEAIKVERLGIGRSIAKRGKKNMGRECKFPLIW